MATINVTRLQRLIESIWGDSKADSLLIITSEKRKTYYSFDDSVFLYLFNTLEPNSVVLIKKTGATLLSTPASSSKFKISSDYNLKTVYDGTPKTEAISMVSSSTVAVSAPVKSLPEFEGLDNFYAEQLAIERALILQEDNEQTRVRNASKIACSVIRNIYLRRLQDDVDSNDPASLEEVSSDISLSIRNPQKLNLNVPIDRYEPSFMPVLGSDGSISTSFPPEIEKGTFISPINTCTVGIRFSGFTAAIGRTYFINANQETKDIWSGLVAGREAACKAIKPDATFSEVYDAFCEGVPEKFREYIPGSIGGFCSVNVITTSIHIEKDSEFKIPQKCSIVLNISLEKVPVGEQTVTVTCVDTIQVQGDQTNILTINSVDLNTIAFETQEDEEAKKVTELLNDNRTIAERARTRGVKATDDTETVDILKKFKEEKHSKKTETQETDEVDEPDDKPQISYTNYTTIPQIEQPNRIFVHSQNLTVFFPIYGMMVPFHVSTLRNIQDDSDSNGQISTMRVNFEVPKTSDSVATNTFIKELSYVCPGSLKFKGIAKQIRDLRARFTLQQKRHKTEREVYEAENLITLPNPPRLTGNLCIYPTLSDKKTAGTLEAHENGFRFRMAKGGQQLVMYKNIRLAILQRSTTELNTLIHFYLKKAIRINNKPTMHVQFYKQVITSNINLEVGMLSKSDSAEMSEEEHDRHLRKKINQEFARFCQEVKSIPSAPDFEQPNRQLAFDGIVSRQVSTLYPMVSSIISVMDKPPFVMMVEDMDVVQFDRVMMSLKYFDIVIIPSDWSKELVSIVQIPTADLQKLKDWLDAVDIKHFQRKNSLDWNKIVNSLKKEGKETFEKNGGWESYLEEEEEDYEESEVFNESEVDDQDSSEEFESADETQSGESEGYESESEEGQDWRQLAEEAAIHDKRADQKDADIEKVSKIFSKEPSRKSKGRR